MGVVVAVEKRYYDSKHCCIEFDVGDKVFLELEKAYCLEGQ